MKSQHSTTTSFQTRALLAAAAALTLAGCGDSAPSAQAGAQPNAASAEATSAPAAGASAAPAAPAAVVKVVPAKVSDAAAVLDLSQVQLLPNAERPSAQVVTHLAYSGPGTVGDAVAFHDAQLKAAGWTELPGKSVSPHHGSAAYAKSGFHVSLTALPEKAKVSVYLSHHGNLRFESLPLPAGAKTVYVGPGSGMFTCDLPAETAEKEITAGLVAAGWEPYGAAPTMRWFRQNAVKLTVLTTPAPAPGGKTSMHYSSEMLSAEIPSPLTATAVQFDNGPRRLTFHWKSTPQDCIGFYQQDLEKSGWKTQLEGAVKTDGPSAVTFYNAAKDILRLEMRPRPEGELAVSVQLRLGTEIAEMKRKMEAQIEANKAKALEAQ